MPVTLYRGIVSRKHHFRVSFPVDVWANPTSSAAARAIRVSALIRSRPGARAGSAWRYQNADLDRIAEACSRAVSASCHQASPTAICWSGIHAVGMRGAERIQFPRRMQAAERRHRAIAAGLPNLQQAEHRQDGNAVLQTVAWNVPAVRCDTPRPRTDAVKKRNISRRHAPHCRLPRPCGAHRTSSCGDTRCPQSPEPSGFERDRFRTAGKKQGEPAAGTIFIKS